MKILNLYAGIGGNRDLWGDEHNITAVELNRKIADEYKKKYTNDIVIVGDAHEYLLEHYKEFDFIWSSPPCPTHSRFNTSMKTKRKMKFPDMSLYQEIIFLEHFFNGKYVVENVIPFYKPFIRAQKIGRHLFWSNFNIKKICQPKNDIGTMIKGHPNRANKKPLKIRNAVNSKLGLHILQEAIKSIKNNTTIQKELF